MIAFSYYLLKVIICSGILFIYYWFALRNKVFHAYNRFYLLATIVLSITLPCIKINIAKQYTAPKIAAIQIIQAVTVSDDYVHELTQAPAQSYFTVNNTISIGYLAISLILFVSLIQILISIWQLFKTNQHTKIENIYLVNTNEAKGTPFSFFRTIFWNNKIDIHSPAGSRIFKHELAHIQEKHSIDKMLVNIVLIVFWCNPIFWLVRKELNMIHEFIADKRAVNDGDTEAFAQMILVATYPQHQFKLTNHFFYSPIKRRIAMITKNQHPKVNYISRLLVLPLAVLLFAAFTFKAKNKINIKIGNKEVTFNNSINDNYSKTKDAANNTLNSLMQNNASVDLETLKHIEFQKIKVVIDAGHGGTDPGARNIDGTLEKDVALALAKKIKEINNNKNIEIILSRSEDRYDDVRLKASFAKEQNPDMFISIHLEAAPYRITHKNSGMDVYISRDSFANNYKSKILATTLINSFNGNYELNISPNPAQRKMGIKVLEANTFPSVIIEAGYITNDKDLAYLKSDKGQTAFAENVLRAIGNYAISKKGFATNIVRDSPPFATITISKVENNEENEELLKHPRITEITTDLDYLKNEGIYIINGKEYSKAEINNKKITGGTATYYKKGNDELIKKYGPKAVNGIVIFENATVTTLIKEKTYTDDKNSFTVTADSIYFVDASQRAKLVSPIQFPMYDNSKTNKNLPLYILDGIKKNAAEMKSFSANKIDSIKVLKGKQATDKYGVEALNGAIEIVSKK